MITWTRWARLFVLFATLGMLGIDCGLDNWSNEAMWINQTENVVEIQVRSLIVNCIEIRSDQIHELTRSDFASAQTKSIDPRTMEEISPHCTTQVKWIQIGDFSQVLRWSGLERMNYPDGTNISEKWFKRAVLIEGTAKHPIVTVGKELEVFPAPQDGPATLPGALDWDSGMPWN